MKSRAGPRGSPTSITTGNNRGSPKLLVVFLLCTIINNAIPTIVGRIESY